MMCNFKNSKPIFILMVFACFLNSCNQISDSQQKNPEQATQENSYADSLFLNALNAKGLFPFEQNDKVGFKDKTGTIIVDAMYDIVPGIKGDGYFYAIPEFLEDNSILIGIRNTNKRKDLSEGEYLFGLIALNGKEIIKPSFHFVPDPDNYGAFSYFYKEGVLGVYFPKQEDKTIFINTKGELIDLSEYESARPISKDLFRVNKKGKCGVVNKNGQIKIPIIYDGVQVDSYLSKGDKKIIEVCNNCRQIETGGSGDYIWDYYIGGKHGLVEENGDVIVPLEYEKIFLAKNIAFLNRGAKIKKEEYDEGEFLSGGKWEMYDPSTNKYSKTKYKEFVTLNSTLVAVNFEEQPSPSSFYNDDSFVGKWGIINGVGEEIIPLKYEQILYDIHNEESKIIIVRNKGKFGVINLKGEELLPLKYADIQIDSYNNHKITARIGDVEEVFVLDGFHLKQLK